MSIKVTTSLTPKEADVLVAFIEEGCDCNGAKVIEDLLEDNMTWLNAKELQEKLPYSKHEIAGIMSSLETKGMICNSQESSSGSLQNDWHATDKGIKTGWPLFKITW